MRVAGSIRDGIVKDLHDSGCVFAEDEAEWLVASSFTLEALTNRVAKRVAGVPFGWTEFYGL